MKKLSEEILENEICWLESINSNVKRENDGIRIEREDVKTSDFNFFHPIKYIDKECCNRISSRDEKFYEFQQDLLFNKMQMEDTFDINLVAFGGKKDLLNNEYQLLYVDYDKWERGTRNTNKYTRYINICYKEIVIGKMSTFHSDSVVGIYDFEIFKSYQHRGHAAKALEQYIHDNNKTVFIQTWSANIYAIKAYLNAGFKIYENLYRYNKV